MTRFDDLVLGGGIGGLALAGLLARDGRKVAVLEASDRPGGYAKTLDLGPARFCAQVQYVFDCGETETVDRLLGKLGLREAVPWLRLDPEGFDVVALPEGRFRIPNGHAKHRERLIRRFPEAEVALRAYFDRLIDTRDEVLQLPSRIRLTDVLLAPYYFPHALRYRTRTLEQVFDDVGMPPLLRGILAGQCGDYFLPPERVSFLMHASLVSAYDRGAFYPRYHFPAMVAALASVIGSAPGSRVECGSEVVRILHRDGRAVGAVTRDGATWEAGRIFSNLDPRVTAELCGAGTREIEGPWHADYEYSAAPLNLYLVLSGIDLRDHGFGNWNFWRYPSSDQNAVYRRQLEEGDLSDPWFFVSSPTCMSPEPGLAPPGWSTLHLVTSASFPRFAALRGESEGEGNYRAGLDRIRETLLDRLEAEFVPGLRNHVRHALVHGPLENADLFRAPRGNAYGAALTPDNVTRHRHPRQSPIEDLYLINATAGYPGVAGMALMALQLHQQLGEPLRRTPEGP